MIPFYLRVWHRQHHYAHTIWLAARLGSRVTRHWPLREILCLSGALHAKLLKSRPLRGSARAGAEQMRRPPKRKQRIQYGAAYLAATNDAHNRGRWWR